MNIDQLISYLRANRDFMQNVVHWHDLPSSSPNYKDLPENLDPRLKQVLFELGIHQLYSHQREVWDEIQKEKNVIIATPTASGKSLSYLLPVVDTILRSPQTRALFIFPTKALAQDQWNVLERFNRMGDIKLHSFTYDGDTSPAARKSVRVSGQIVITNPDMLHAGILPHHTRWVKLFENLRFIVIDELHYYRGVFGSHFANVLQRLRRIQKFYNPAEELRFLLSSATIANPREHASNLTSEPLHSFSLINQSGAPQGKRSYIFYNPPVVQKELGIRRSALKEAARLGDWFIQSKISSIFFLRSRVRVEVLTKYLRSKLPSASGAIRAYRGGYLANERRNIEQGLRKGSIHTVVSTNALELGVDIGSLDVAVSIGYPGSIASLYQQFGRAGRSMRSSVAIFIATSAPMEQFVMQHPDYLMQNNIEQALLNPDNLLIKMAHLKCAAFELPLRESETMGSYEVTELASYLAEEKVLKKESERYYWMSDIFPANEVSLRSASNENFVIIDQSSGGGLIGELDFYAAPTLIHEKAIYLHQGESYLVKKLDWDKRQAYVEPCRPDYFTDAEEKVNFQILEQEKDLTFVDGQRGARSPEGQWHLHYGEIALRKQPVLFKKIKLFTHENAGWGKISLPEIQMHTQASWISFEEEFLNRFFPLSLHGLLLKSLSYVLGNLAPVFVMGDKSDIRSLGFVKSPFDQKPVLLFYDSYPGGIALSRQLFSLMTELLSSAAERIRNCNCSTGCPSCIGPFEMHVDEQEEFFTQKDNDWKGILVFFLESMLQLLPQEKQEHSMMDAQNFTLH